jgi:signal transduction histidine kinase
MTAGNSSGERDAGRAFGKASPVASRTDLTAAAALRERVKELTCLYGIAELSGRPEASIDEILQGIAGLLPPAWQYPEVATARVMLDGRSHATPGFKEGVGRPQRSELLVNGQARGFVEVVYVEERPVLDEGPFLKEERNLIDTIARHVSVVIERREASREQARLQEQLRHADRLATIGQLAAGVAHEINEPLGSILGFAQLAEKHPSVPAEVSRDLARIVDSSMHAREIIRKLMTFARQTPPAKSSVDLNELIGDGLTFFEARCAKAGVDLVRKLDPQLPSVTADSAQVNQVIVNLVVNALQAMPSGGTLEVITCASDTCVELLVSDTGEGMSAEVRKKIFLPFFTTKDVKEGTGLGLSVVHGIVAAHGGSIDVESRPDQGSTFRVRLPVADGETSKEETEYVRHRPR